MTDLTAKRERFEQRITREYAAQREEVRRAQQAILDGPKPISFDALSPLIQREILLRLDEAWQRHIFGFEPCGLTGVEHDH